MQYKNQRSICEHGIGFYEDQIQSKWIGNPIPNPINCKYCGKVGKVYTYKNCTFCTPCQINKLRRNPTKNYRKLL